MRSATTHRVGIISDTHWSREDQFDPNLEDRLNGVELILHAGDVVAPFVLERLRRIAPVRGVRGNCDPLTLNNALAPKLELDLWGVKVGLLHGHQSNPAWPEAYLDLFTGPLDVLVHGHSHLATNRVVRNVCIFNPGSVSQPRNSLPPTLGMLEVAEGAGIRSLQHLTVSEGEELLL